MSNSLDKLLRNIRPATPEELKEQGESLARNYKPGPRQARLLRSTAEVKPMAPKDLIAAIHRLVHGAALTPLEAFEIHQLVDQNTDWGRIK